MPPLGGIILAAIICIPFWLAVILLVMAGVIAMRTIIFAGSILSGLLLFLILSAPKNTKQNEQDKQLFRPVTKVRFLYNMKMELNMADNGGTRIFMYLQTLGDSKRIYTLKTLKRVISN